MKNKKELPRLLTQEEIHIIFHTFDKLSEPLCRHDYTWWLRYSGYFEEALRQNANGELITHLNEKFVEDLDYRYGAKTVKGMIGQVLSHTNYIKNGLIVKPLLDKASQLQEMDLAVWSYDNQTSFYTSVKLNHRRKDNTLRLGDDYFVKVGPLVTYIDFADLDTLSIYHFDVTKLKNHFLKNRHPTNENGFIYEQLNWLPSHEFFKVI